MTVSDPRIDPRIDPKGAREDEQITTDPSKPVERMRSGSMTLSLAPWVIAAVVLAFLPLVFTNNSALTIMNQMSITIVFALAYNMLLGQGGMLSFGHAVYAGVGGFAAMHIMNMSDFFSTIPLVVLPVFAGLFGMGLALIVGSFSTRSAGTVFAMISMRNLSLAWSFFSRSKCIT